MARGELCDIINGAAPPKDGSKAADPLTVGVIGGGGDAATNKVRRRWCTLPNAKRAATLQPRGAAGAPGTHKRPQRVTGLYTQIGSAPMVLAVRGCEARRLLARSGLRQSCGSVAPLCLLRTRAPRRRQRPL